MLATIATACLVIHHVLLRAMAHGHVAHALLASRAALPAGATFVAVSLVVARFVSVVLAPGLLLAAGAEIVAYLLVGPKRAEEDGEGDDAPPAR